VIDQTEEGKDAQVKSVVRREGIERPTRWLGVA
jgi:hypothetical protein